MMVMENLKVFSRTEYVFLVMDKLYLPDTMAVYIDKFCISLNKGIDRPFPLF